MNPQLCLLLAIALPLGGAFLLPFIGRISASVRNASALLLVCASVLCSALLVKPVVEGQTAIFTWGLPFGFNLVLSADALAVFMALVSSFISAVIVVFSFGYIRHYEHQGEYYTMVVLFLGAMMGLIFSANLIFLYLFWEITAFTSWRLIGFFREREHVLKADKAFLVTAAGALLMLIGFLIIYQQTGSFDLATLRQRYAATALPNTAALLILAGIFSKSATLPFHTWLPDAGIAPSPVTALLHAAILVKIGVYVFARLFLATFHLDPSLQSVVLSLAALSALVSAGAALVETDIKRIIAYSTVSQIGFMFFGLAVGTEEAVFGALLYILMHGLAKAGLFLGAGIIEQNTKTKDITKMGGLIHSMPLTAVAFLFCALSVMGIPPFGGFFSKDMLFSGAFQGGRMGFGFIFLACAGMTVLYLLRLFNAIFLGPRQIEGAKESSPTMVYCVVLLAALSLLGGLMIGYPSEFVRLVVGRIMGSG